MDVPVLNVYQAGFGLIVGVTGRAFNNIATVARHCNNRARPTMLAALAINRLRNIYIALHISIYVSLFRLVVGKTGFIKETYFTSLTSIQKPSGSVIYTCDTPSTRCSTCPVTPFQLQ